MFINWLIGLCSLKWWIKIDSVIGFLKIKQQPAFAHCRVVFKL